jgi:flagellar protein FliS
MDTKGFREYKEHAINTMTQGEQLLLLYDELVKRLVRAELALDKSEYEVFEDSVDHSVAIINYLDSILNREYEISGNLSRLYDFMTYELARVKAGRNRTELERVKGMSLDLRDAFQQAEKNNTSGK